MRVRRLKTNMSKLSLIVKGIIKENPTFVLVLGMCPTLGTTTSAINGMGMGLATTFVLILSNMVISGIAPLIPSKVKIPSYIVVIAALVTILQFVMQAYGRAEAYACKNSILDSALDGIGIGLGFTASLTVIGFVRELLGGLSVFGNKLVEADGMLAFVLAPGAFLVLGYLMVLFNKATKK